MSLAYRYLSVVFTSVLRCLPRTSKPSTVTQCFADRPVTVLLLVVLVTSQLVACSLPPPRPITYDKTVSTSSSLSANVAVRTGSVEGTQGQLIMVQPGVFIPLPMGSLPPLMFNVEDQENIGHSLASELDRLGLFTTVHFPASAMPDADVQILLDFVKTFHNSGTHEYILDVNLQLQSDVGHLQKRYHISSAEGDSIWQKMNTDAWQGKEKAGVKLMNAMIPDISKWVAEQDRKARK